MSASYVSRSLTRPLRRASAQFPVVVLSGPRQAGKTTLLRETFAGKAGYVSLDAPDLRGFAREDPRAFLARYKPPLIIDEIQHVPELLPYIKEAVDARRGKRGQFLLSGSQNLLLMEQVTESLAGRAAILRLLPFSWRELDRQEERPLPWERPRKGLLAPQTAEGLWPRILRGGYPEIALDRRRDASLWFGGFQQTYLERDVRLLRQVGDLQHFQLFIQTLAAGSGQLLNMADLGRGLGLALNTVKAWLSVLEATQQILVLRPWHANIHKRLVKTPKVYFTDTGLLCWLTGLHSAAHAAAGPLAGTLMETAVVGEIHKTLLHQGRPPRLHFWRTTTGDEVDLLVETKRGLLPIEIKSGATPRPEMADGLRRFRALLPDTLPGLLIHGGELDMTLSDGTRLLPWHAL